MLYVFEIKNKVEKIKKIVSELYQRPLVVETIVEIVIPTVHFPNRWVDLAISLIVETIE